MSMKTWNEIRSEIEGFLGDKTANNTIKEAISRLSDYYIVGDVRESMRKHYDDVLKKYVVEPLKREKIEDTIIEKIISIVRPWALKIIEGGFENNYKWYRDGYINYQAIINRKKNSVDNKTIFNDDEPLKIKCAQEVYDWHTKTCEAMGIEKPTMPDWLVELSDLLAQHPTEKETNAAPISNIETEVEWETEKKTEEKKANQGTLESFGVPA